MQRSLNPPRTMRRLQRTSLDFVVLFFLLASMMLTAVAATWQFWHANRIFAGVTVGGAPVGGLTRAAALKLLHEKLYAYPLPPVSIEYRGQQWPLEQLQVKAEADFVAGVNQAYLMGRQGSLVGNLVEQVRGAFLGHAITPPLQLDQPALAVALEQIAAKVERSGMAARQIGAVAVPAQAGVVVDVDATLQAVVDALQRTSLHETAVVPLVATTSAPPEPLAVVGSAGSPQQAVIDRPLVLKSEQTGFEFALDPARLTSMLVSTQPPQIDESRLRAYLADLAAQIDVPARDARLRFDASTGAVSVIQSSQPGRELDVDAAVTAIQNALASGAAEAPLAVAAVAPSVDMNRIAEMGIRELVASGSTYFAGSSASRVRNIEVAAEKFDGVVIPPAGIFSFNDIVRDVSSANGFEDSLVIWGDRTAVGVGGGVCQTSTTLFRAAYEGGFPIVQRANHGYVVDWYGKPGLDATIFTPSVDFRFRNDTNAYLLIEPVVDTANGVITFNFYGTRPERVVTVGEPVITDVKDPEPPSYVVDESLETGEKKQVEWEKQGMTATVERTIVENGETRTDTLLSKYQPWRAVYLVGPGTEIPATPTPAPSAEESAQPASDGGEAP